MVSKNINSVPFYFFENLKQLQDLLHFVSTRDGGISEGGHFSLNLSLRVNDDPLNVKRNREVIAKQFGLSPVQLVFASQTHNDKVALIDPSFLEMDEDDQNISLHGVDAMVTNLKEICLCILTADCASVLLYDPVVQVIGIAHAGWKGTIKKIAAKTVSTMTSTYGSKPENIIAAIGPCISAISFEVGEEVADEFENTFKGSTEIVLRKPEWPKPHVDIVAANKQILKSAGIKDENVEVSGICTFLNNDIFFSARKQAQGRFGAGLMMKTH